MSRMPLNKISLHYHNYPIITGHLCIVDYFCRGKHQLQASVLQKCVQMCTNGIISIFKSWKFV